MTPEQRLARAERILVMLANAGRRARQDWRAKSRLQREDLRFQREESRSQSEKINILISMHIKNEEAWRAESQATNEKINTLINSQREATEQIKGLAVGQAELARSQKLTDQALRAFIDGLRKGRNQRSKH